jgi:hypothetical protein
MGHVGILEIYAAECDDWMGCYIQLYKTFWRLQMGLISYYNMYKFAFIQFLCQQNSEQKGTDFSVMLELCAVTNERQN